MRNRKLWLIILVLSLLAFACNLPGDVADSQDTEQQEEIGQPDDDMDDLEDGEDEKEIEDMDKEGDVDEENDVEDDDEEDEVEEPEDDIPPVALACPDSVSGKLIMNHTWVFNTADEETMEINGSTDGESAWCVITIERENVIFDECNFSYNNSGTVTTDAGDCTITGEGVAVIEVTGSCIEGVVTLEIDEWSDGDLGNTMTCPGVTQPYPTFFPPSTLEFDFLLTPGGDTWTHYGMIDFSFEFTKAWTLLLPDSYFDED